MLRKTAYFIVACLLLVCIWSWNSKPAAAQNAAYPGPATGTETFTCWYQGAPYDCSVRQVMAYARQQTLALLNQTPQTYSSLTMSDPNPLLGDQASITDAQTCTFLAPVTGGGTSIPICPVIWNGSQWVAR